MKLNKYFYLTTLTYLVIFLTPLVTIVYPLTPTQLVNLTTVAYLVGAIAILVIASRLTERPVIERRVTNRQLGHVLLWGIVGIFFAFVAQSLAVLIEDQLFNIEPGSENTQNVISIIKEFPLYIIAVTIGGPIMEELVFRRALTGVLTQRFSPLLTASVSSLAFSLAHFDGHLLIYFTMGMTFYFLYQKTGSIWAPIIAHCGMNSILVLAQLAMTQV